MVAPTVATAAMAAMEAGAAETDEAETAMEAPAVAAVVVMGSVDQCRNLRAPRTHLQLLSSRRAWEAPRDSSAWAQT